MKYEEITRDIEAGRWAPIYFLSGEEPYFIDDIATRVERKALPEEAKDLNQTIVFGNEVSMSSVTDAARAYPWMADRRVVIVKEAQNIRDFDNLTPYIDHVQPTTILVFLYKNKKPDKRKGVFKKLASSKNVVYLDAAKLYDNQVPAWIERYCRERGHGITPKAAQLLADSIGTDLSRVVHELDKLLLLLPPDGTIKESLVETHTGISREFNAFELTSAIAAGDIARAGRVVNYMEANPKAAPLVMTIATLFRYFLNLLTYHYERRTTPGNAEMARLLGVNPYFMKEYTEGARRYNAMACARTISLLREYDLKSKGVGNAGIPDGELLRELIFKIMHP